MHLYVCVCICVCTSLPSTHLLASNTSTVYSISILSTYMYICVCVCVCVCVHTHISCHVLSNTVTNKNARAVYCCYGYLLRRTLLFASIYLVASDTLAVQVLWLLNHSLITLLKCMYLYVKRYALGHKPFVLISLWGDLGCPTSLITHTLVAIHIRVLNMAVAIAGWREVAQFKVALWPVLGVTHY